MKEITLEIGQLIDFIKYKYNIDFKGNDSFIDVPFKLELPDENNEWQICSKFYKKKAPLYELKLKNDIVLKAADYHILVDSNYNQRFVKDLKMGDNILCIEVESNNLIKDNEDVYSPSIDSEKHLYKTPDGLVHHNTFTVTETCKKFMNQSPTKAKYVYEAGDIGSSMSALVPFFYKHSQNCVIVLDDNDKMVMNGLSQDIMNIMKALLDPKAADEKPVTVRANMLDIFAARLADLDDDDGPIAGKKMNEGHLFELNEDALREGRMILSIDGEPVVDKLISLRETHELQNRLKPLREKQERYVNPYAKDLRSLREASNKEMLDDMFSEDEDGEEEEMLERDAIRTQGGPKDDEEKKSSFPRRWYFNSSVIFISNLEMIELNTAVLDRVQAVELKLTLDQFLEHLGNIYGGLGKIGMGTRIDPAIREWSKKCVYTLIGIAIEAWKANKPVFGKPIEINRKLTFRMFDEFVSAWERYAMDHAEERGETLNVKNTKMLDELSISLIPEMMRRKVIPFLATKVRSS